MKRISVQDLKAQLSTAIAEAESGNTIVITRHNEPVAQLVPIHPTSIHWGKSVGTASIRPAIKRGIRIPYLEALLEDRNER
jgi:prevent-host-death family protein